MRLVAFCEAAADFQIASDLVDRILREGGPDWVADVLLRGRTACHRRRVHGTADLPVMADAHGEPDSAGWRAATM